MTKDAVLAILRKENDYISGEHISRLLGVSRAAVNTAVKALRAEGYEISSSTNKGYHLDAVPNSISAQELAAYLDEARMQTVECLASVDSTNNRLRELALAGAPNGQVVLANEQTQGKGRRGRAFASPQDNGIYLSILFHPDTLPTDIVEITAWTAVATNNAIEEVCGVRAGIKWVNDLVIDRKKICGILTEMSVESESGYIQYLIIGIGINVNGQAEDFPAGSPKHCHLPCNGNGKNPFPRSACRRTDSGAGQHVSGLAEGKNGISGDLPQGQHHNGKGNHRCARYRGSTCLCGCHRG
ncbi:MAG: biotin--[acetyl-CoA-carboxylase] ligase [Anaerotignum faecicola]